jgi:transposase
MPENAAHSWRWYFVDMPLQQGTNRHQTGISSLDDCIAADNPVRLIDALVEKLDLQKLGIAMPQATEGRPAFHPKVLLKLYLYGYMNRVRTSRKLERECLRNKEACWLLEELQPCYKTIADFRRDHPVPLKNVFRLFTAFLREPQLMEGKIIAADGSKFRAVNSRKKNYNMEKIRRHQDYLSKKTEEYLQQLDENDRQEEGSDELEIKRTAIVEQLKKLNERELRYDELEKQITESDATQVSTTDAESRSLLISHNLVEVSYNVQTVSDEKHSLVAHFEVTSENDKQALHKTASDAKQEMQSETLTVLADKGYHTGAELAKCEADDITTLVSPKESSAQNPDEKYAVENFIYNQEQDTYICPQGETLKTNGNWYDKSHDDKNRKGGTRYRVKHYKTTACKTCAVKAHCTRNKNGRLIERSEHQQVVDRNNARVKAQYALYKRRQELIEHIFGTIKRGWGYTYTLLKGKKKITGEFSLIYLAYNFTRAKNILGFDKMLEAINNWTPKYPEGFDFLLFRLYYITYKPLKIFDHSRHTQKMTA